MSSHCPRLVLVAEDEVFLRELIADILVEKGYQVLQAEDGKDALRTFQAVADIAFVITDVQMPEMGGIEFMLASRKIRKVPFVFITAFTDLLDLPKAYELGASEFLTKPFKTEDFSSCLELIEHELKNQTSTGSATLDLDYCRVHVDEFISGSTVNADVFLKLGDHKYLCVAKKGSPMARDRIESYKRKGLEFFFIRREDFAAYVGLNITLATSISSRGNVSRSQKQKLLRHTIEVAIQDAYINGIDKEKFAAAKGLVETTLNVVTSSADLYSLLESLRNSHDRLYSHSLAVSLYSMAVVQRFGWTAPSLLTRIAMAGLFHDIGKKEIPHQVMEKPRIDRTTDEVLMFENHTLRGKDLLCTIPGIPEEVARVAAEHHENQLGRGYPLRLTRTRIHPLAAVIGTVDEFVVLALPLERAAPLPPKEAIQLLYDRKREELHKFTIKALMELFACPIPPELEKISMPKGLI